MVRLAQASHDEHGNCYHGGAAGDQTGTEVAITNWYSYPWTHVIHWNKRYQGRACAKAAKAGALNNHIGYDQYQRNDLLKAAKAVGFDLSKVAVNTETDCTAFASVCAIAAGADEGALFEGGNLAYSGNFVHKINRAADVTICTSQAWLNGTANLAAGDILLNENCHAAIVLEDGKCPVWNGGKAAFQPGTYKLLRALWVRKGAGTANKPIEAKRRAKGTTVTVTAVKCTSWGNTWGRVKGGGWVALDWYGVPTVKAVK